MSDVVPGGLGRRAVAMLLDLLVAVIPTLVLMSAIGAMVPLDNQPGAVFGVMFLAVGAGLAYVFWGVGVLGNTLGRYVVGVRVSSNRSPGRPTLGQAFLRSLPVGLWPVEAAMVAIRSDGRRLGDLLAGTAVERYQPAASLGRRIGLYLLVVVPGVIFAFASVPLINGRTLAAEAAQAYVLAEEGMELGAPRGVWIQDDQAVVTFKLDQDSGRRVSLRRNGGQWTVEASESILADQVGWWSYSYSSGSSP